MSVCGDPFASLIRTAAAPVAPHRGETPGAVPCAPPALCLLRLRPQVEYSEESLLASWRAGVAPSAPVMRSCTTRRCPRLTTSCALGAGPVASVAWKRRALRHPMSRSYSDHCPTARRACSCSRLFGDPGGLAVLAQSGRTRGSSTATFARTPARSTRSALRYRREALADYTADARGRARPSCPRAAGHPGSTRPDGIRHGAAADCWWLASFPHGGQPPRWCAAPLRVPFATTYGFITTASRERLPGRGCIGASSGSPWPKPMR